MKRIFAVLAALLAACQAKPPPLLAVAPAPVSHWRSVVTTIAADAADARATANWYVKTASAMQISRVTVLTMTMQNAVRRMQERETMANVAAARAAMKALQDYLKEARDATAQP